MSNHGLGESAFQVRVDSLLPESAIKKARRLIASGTASQIIADLTGMSKEQVQAMRQGGIIAYKPEEMAEEKPIKRALEIPDRNREIRIMDIAKRVRHPNLREIDSVSVGVNVYIGVVL